MSHKLTKSIYQIEYREFNEQKRHFDKFLKIEWKHVDFNQTFRFTISIKLMLPLDRYENFTSAKKKTWKYVEHYVTRAQRLPLDIWFVWNKMICLQHSQSIWHKCDLVVEAYSFHSIWYYAGAVVLFNIID